MAREVRSFDVTVPAGTAKAAPVTIKTEFPPRSITELEIIVPPGPRGLMGFQIAQAGNQVYPTERGAFFVTDNETIRWPIEEANTSGAWAVIGYNTGAFDHTVEVRFLVDLPGDAGAGIGFQPLLADSISNPAPVGDQFSNLLPAAPALPAAPVI